MKRTLQVLALIIAVGALGLWALLGANRGWTRTTVPVKTVDEVTGIEGIQYQKKFVPGVDLLGGALLGSALFAGSSILFRKKQQKQAIN
jgi:hypothetical protein